MDMREFISAALVGVLGDFLLYNIIQAFATATPGWATIGWGLFAAYNGAILFFLGHALKKEN